MDVVVSTTRRLEVGGLLPFAPMLRRYLFVLGAAPDRLDDLVQDVFVTALEKSFEDRGPAATGGLLRAVARHLLLRARRSAAARREVELAHEAWCEDAAIDGDEDGDGRVAALRACLDALPARCRQLLRGAYEDRLGRHELAARFGLRPGGVKTALRRVREALRQCVERKRGSR